MKEFPPGFLWGTSTAAHQVEGANDNSDWWDWELTPGHIKHGDRSAIACDWWRGERYREDFDYAREMGLDAHRLSVEWSRLEPSEGVWSTEGFAFYRRVLTALRDRAMVPMVTLHHFTNPRWLAEKGGWERPEVVPLFERYAAKVAETLGDLTDLWVTINEPTVYVVNGYLNGIWPPGKRDFRLGMKVGLHLLKGHLAAYRAIHRLKPTARVGMAHHIRTIMPENAKSIADRLVAEMQHRANNLLFLLALEDGKVRFPMGAGGRIDGLAGANDLIGLNFYFSSRVKFDLRFPLLLFGRQMPAEPWGTSFDNELRDWFGLGNLDPEAFYATTKWLSRFGRPIFVTENGVCDRTDEIRPRVLVRYLAALHRAIEEGAPVKGYFHWSLVDNFEWKEGYSLRFGLVESDAATQKRTPRPSAKIYGRIARDNAISDDLLTRFSTSHLDQGRHAPDGAARF